METEYQEHAKVFKAFCDPKRLAILEQLRGGEKCACVLLEPLNLTQSGLSYHMKILCESGIVVSRQEGKWTHYRLSVSGRDKALDLLKKLTTPDTEHEISCPLMRIGTSSNLRWCFIWYNTSKNFDIFYMKERLLYGSMAIYPRPGAWYEVA